MTTAEAGAAPTGALLAGGPGDGPPDAGPPGPAPGPAGRARRRARVVPVAVWCLCALQLVLVTAWSLLMPPWRGPDEPNHADAAIALRDQHTYPPYDARDMDAGIRATLAIVHFERRSIHLTAAEAPHRADRPSLSDLDAAGASVDLTILNRPGIANHITQHPPGYYILLAGASKAVDVVEPGAGLGAHDRELSVLRLISLALLSPLPLVAWWVAREAGVGPPVALAAAVLPLAIPQLAHISALVNSDGLVALLVGVLTGFVVRMGRGRVDARTVALAGLVTGAALFTKGLALAAVPLAAGAVVVGYRRAAERPRLPLVAALALQGAVAFAAGGWWWVANLVRYHDLSPSIEYETRLSDPPAGFSPRFGEWFGNWAPKLTGRFWGDYGWIDTRLAWPAVVTCTAVGVLGVVLGVLGRGREGDGGPGGAGGRPDGVTLALLATPFLLLHFFVAFNSYRLYRNAGFSPMVQGRYLFGGVAGVAVLVALGWHRVAGRWTPVAAFGAALLLQGYGMSVALTYYWGEADASPAGRLRALVAWSPWPGPVTGAVGAALALAVVVAGVAVTRATLAAGRGGGPGAPVPAAAGGVTGRL